MKKLAFLLSLSILFTLKADNCNVSEKEPMQEVSIEIRITCPAGDDLRAFVESIPPSNCRVSDFTEWNSAFVQNMTQLIHLAEKGQIETSFSVEHPL